MWLVVFTEQAQKDAKQLKAAGLAGKAKALVAAVREDPIKVPPRALRPSLAIYLASTLAASACSTASFTK